MADTTTRDDRSPHRNDDTGTVPPSRRRPLAISLRVVAVAAIVAGMVWSVVDQWPQVRATWLGLAWESVALSVAAALAGMFANSMAWRAAARDLEQPLSVPSALQICMVGQLGKYIPGSVWAYVLQMELGRRAGMPRARAFLTALIALGLGVVAALGLGLLSLPVLREATRSADPAYAGAVRVALYIVAGMFPIALACAIPPVLTRLVGLALRILRRPPLEHRLSLAGVLAVVGWSVVGYTLFGLHLWLLTNAQAAPGVRGLLVCVGAFAIAMTVGMFAFLSPSGLGVREAVLVAALAPVLAVAGGVGAATGIAFASRLIFTIADVLGAGVAALFAVRQVRRSAGRGPTGGGDGGLRVPAARADGTVPVPEAGGVPTAGRTAR